MNSIFLVSTAFSALSAVVVLSNSPTSSYVFEEHQPMSFEMSSGNKPETHLLTAPDAKALEKTGAKLQEIGNPTNDLESSRLRSTSPKLEPTHLVMTNPFSEQRNKAQTDTSFERPPVAMAWTPADNLTEDTVAAMARHDLVFSGPDRFKLRWQDQKHKGLSTEFTEQSILDAQAMRKELEQKNPQIKLLTELRYRDAPADYLPSDSNWWLRNAQGGAVDGWKGKDRDNYKKMDFTNTKLQDQIAAQARAAVRSGAVDGVMLDWFNDGEEKSPPFEKARLQLLTKIREAIGPDKLIMINTNSTEMPENVTKLVNGYYMECNNSTTPSDWKQIAKTLDYAERNTRQPHINFVETWPDQGHGREQQNKMRATLTLAMTHAPDAYGLFADADGTNKDDHSHDWYKFYDTPVGKPSGQLTERPDGSSTREYTNGTVLYNPAGNKPVTIDFNEPRQSARSGKWSKTFTVDPEDGDIFTH